MKHAFIALFALSLAACEANLSELQQELNQMRQEAKSVQAEAMPSAVANVRYQTPNMPALSAFDPQRVGISPAAPSVQTASDSSASAPNHAPEQGDVAANGAAQPMKYLGFLQNGSQIKGFLEMAEQVHEIRVGQTIGEPPSKIIAINAEAVILEERVPIADGVWEKRRKRLPLHIAADTPSPAAPAQTPAQPID
ncbi:MAG: pilus assembly protein PilP [Neisseria sp.]|nr:pilus assembly protein PilP [Neisseria sp.]